MSPASSDKNVARRATSRAPPPRPADPAARRPARRHSTSGAGVLAGATGGPATAKKTTPRQNFQEELRALEQRALGGLDIVLEQLDRMLEALAHQDVELAQIVIADDDRVDGRYLEVHQGILSLLALPVPGRRRPAPRRGAAARDERIERMGDQCVNISKLIPLSGHEPPRRRALLEPLLRMGALARSEVTQSKAAFAARDVGLAEDLVRQDRDINRLQRDIFRMAIEVGDDTDTREWAMHMILVARALRADRRQRRGHRRAGAFVVTGLFREFSDSSHPMARGADEPPAMAARRCEHPVTNRPRGHIAAT